MTRDKALLEAMAAAIYKSDNFVLGSPAFDRLDAGIQQAYVRAAEASLSAAEAHGWVLVPKVPTEAMSKAFWAKQLPGERDMFTWFKAAWPEALTAIEKEPEND